MLIDSSTPKINPHVAAPRKVLKQKEPNKWINPPAIICTLTGAVLGVVYYFKKYNIKIIKQDDGGYVFLKHIPNENVEIQITRDEADNSIDVKLALLILASISVVAVVGFYGVRKFTKKPVTDLNKDPFKLIKDAKKDDPTPVLTAAPTPTVTEQPDAAAKPSASIPPGVKNSFEGDPPEEVEHGVLVLSNPRTLDPFA